MAELFLAGAGYVARPLADALQSEGWTVSGTVRDWEKVAGLKAAGIRPVEWRGQTPLPADVVENAGVILVSVPPDADGCPVARAIAELPPNAIVLYLSSSGVYGDHGGAWIDETTPCAPTSLRGRRRLIAEGQWRDLADRYGARLHICRLTGIYGPGRNALESLRGGTRGAKAGLAQRIIKPGQVFNRIHRDDIVAGLRVLLDAEDAPEILNFADGQPSPPQDVLTHAARLLGIEPPPEVAFDKAEMSDMARSFYRDNKRLKNERLLALPGFSFRFPDYRAGLEGEAARLGLAA